MKKEFSFGTQVRKSPYFDATVRWGAKGFSVYNHMYIPRDFGDPVQNFWNLVNDAILCDVAVERQVEITGPDAAQFVQLLTPRNLSECAVGQCKYVLITDENGGVLNDPVLLRLAENHFWLSLADSDILMWAKGVAVNSGLDVNLGEPDVSPLQLQGPRSGEIAKAIFGERIDSLKYYWLKEFELNGIPLIISRTGWSSELGYEIYLRDGSRGNELWDHIMEIGEPMGLVPGHTSTIRRIEGGMLSYQADMDYTVNPFELGLGRLVDLEMDANFIGKEALKKIKSEGVKRHQVGIEISCTPLKHPNTSYWPILVESEEVGYITSAVYSPRLDKNIALAMMDVNHSAIDTAAETTTPEGNFPIKVVQKPFYDPKKKITSGS
ncbi:glycine cleavage T C-terminal barrel domain-containing protein [Candidatus Pseudothioglobus singularis]|jgi:glycine cleavage system aminomethyltransferase T|uniref:Glycine cleavage system protein T n=1 Tax=Candidatus Pseudothioglobus singularis PS1 TaxID=1125411 RepID=A0A0M5KU44_9GAMM|nr:glycine cleavage T C-terminal barrel domain-containing protein [Candidatus Pseudothioglobus singularis]ALE02548.1 glycine cleavage system protein T [Candidatus Pseudothioglobus singularis PS1]